MTNSGSTLSPSRAGITADYSYGGPEWDRKLRLGVGGLEKAYPLSYGLSYETKAAVGQTAEVIDLNGESAGIRTQDPRLKRASQAIAIGSYRVRQNVAQALLEAGLC